MDYEKKYKDALDGIKALLKEGEEKGLTIIFYRNKLEEIFSELAESKDEKIRKWLIRTLKGLNTAGVDIKGAYEMMLPSIAWLEKQGEQKPANWLQELEDKLANATSKQLAEWKEKYFKEEPAEWSEEDEMLLFSVIWHLRDSVNNGDQSSPAGKLEPWIRTLKERVQVQSNQEWSEEDNIMVENIRNSFGLHCGQMTEALKEQYDKFFNKVKSLRPQSHWKPDSSMLICLEYAIKHINKDGDKRILSKLLEQLKKLREE